ncbi:hypothetical protein C8J56DRAFT_1135339 [Mycena floridula]|nr:hypothetical protein C8J56DRAFT_1135339 [Mycena floridula]
MDSAIYLPSSKDLEHRIAKLIDPVIDLKTKLNVAIEIRDMIDTIREAESKDAVPILVPGVLELLRLGETSFFKNTLEYEFRKVLLEILNRTHFNEPLKPHAPNIVQTMLHIIRQDNEDNAITACKIFVEAVKIWRCLTEDTTREFLTILFNVMTGMKAVIPELLSESSPVLDPNSLRRSSQSFKVLSEMGLVIVVFCQCQYSLIAPEIPTTLTAVIEFLSLESPAQRTAREDAEAMGSHWAGMAPTIRNPVAYSELVNAQIKLLSYIAWRFRPNEKQLEPHADSMMLMTLRILQDCPRDSVSFRKELMLVFRHFMATKHHAALVPHIEKLMDERVIFGTGLASKELLRVNIYTAMADLVHHLKADFTIQQLSHIVLVYSRLLHDPVDPISLHIVYGKTMFHVIEPLVNKEAPVEAGKILTAIFETSVDRLDALVMVQGELFAAVERAKINAMPALDRAFIEKSRSVGGAAFAIDKPEDVLTESRMLFKTLLHGLRIALMNLKKVDAPSPDGTLIFRLFEGCIRGMALFDHSPHDTNDVIEWLTPLLCEVDLHVFQEVWTHKIEFFVNFAHKRIGLLNLCQSILAREPVSPTLLAIMLKFLVDRLPLLGEYDDHTAAATIRLFKMGFQAVSQHMAVNEPILASHLPKLLMDCFPLATKATKPTNYLHLLRVLFRAIGGGGGRFELLYKEVLPLLPEMLECLNRQLVASEGTTRDMIVELCLTVPLRLTHLLPHLTYLMQPLALALRGGPDLVSQGLRTLELCIDNLTPDFLDPTLNTVLRELMDALHAHLKPSPASHPIAHTTIRILGKLGGRNRRLLAREPSLDYIHCSETANVPVSFSGNSATIVLDPIANVARRTLKKKGSPTDIIQAFAFMENAIGAMLYEGVRGRNIQELFVSMLEGIFDALHIPEVQSQAQPFLRNLSTTIFQTEIRSASTREPIFQASALLTAFLDAWPHALCREVPEDVTKSKEFIASLVNDLVDMSKQPGGSLQDILPILKMISNRFIALGLEHSWICKSAACTGFSIMGTTPIVGPKWVVEREQDIVRALLHILKDVSPDFPRDSSAVLQLLFDVLHFSTADPDFNMDEPNPGKNRLILFAGLFTAELNNSNAVVRQAAQACIQLLTEFAQKPVAEILRPHRERMNHILFTKPLRALPIPSQIGNIEATRYCVSLDPPLIELGDELLRLLHETLALADAEDSALIGRSNPRQNGLEVTKLRVACIKLLTASMPMTDFFSRQHQTRQRVTGVYFKSLYSPSLDVKDVAHEGLRMVLMHQSRLPKELLQTGLRPILMNLADPKRLSVPGLEGLARLLELLTNYFKVEIGHKLLDHFRIVADPQMLQASSRLPLGENEGITKLVCLANIFHLLPSAANTFLEQLVNLIVQTEAQMHFSGRSPFSEPLAKYLDRYSEQGISFFLENLSFPRHLRTLRSILHARLAPNLERELGSRTSTMVAKGFKTDDKKLLLPTLQLFSDLAEILPYWFIDNKHVIDDLLEIWRSNIPSVENLTVVRRDIIQRHTLLISIFKVALERSPRIDLLFEIVALFTRNLEINFVDTVDFLYKHVALSADLIFRRNILMRFLTWFSDPAYSWAQKTAFLRYIITPTLIVGASRDPAAQLLDTQFVDAVDRLIWCRIQTDSFRQTDDTFKVEILHFTTVMVQHYSHLVEFVKKDIIKFATHLINVSDDIIVKQTGYLLTAHFFAAWPSPSKFILNTWNGLLRVSVDSRAEGRPLVRQEALATLAQSLSRLNVQEGDAWAIHARRLLSEEGFTFALTIYYFITKEPELFYPVRGLFVTHIVNSLSKLGLSNSSNHESRVLSIEVLQVIFDWEIKATKAGEANQWITPRGYKETIVGYLIRLASHYDPVRPTPTIGPRALPLLQIVAGPNGWTDVSVGLRFFERALEQIEFTEANMPAVIASAKTLHVLAAEKDDLWYTVNADKLQKLVRKGMGTEDPSLHDALHPIVDRLLRLFPLPKEDEEQQGELVEFHSFVNSAIGEGLRNMTNVRGTLLMLKSVVQVVPERIDSFGGPLMKLFFKLAKDHIQAPPPGSDAVVKLLILSLDICQMSMAFMGDNRRVLVSNLVHVIEKSKSQTLCQYILTMCRTWALTKQEPYPFVKEKVALLLKLAVFEGKGEQLFQQYLELIFEIYTDPTLRRSDLTARLESAFMLGCRAKDPTLRERFIDLFDVSVPRSLFSRLVYICGVQNWDPLADHNWIYLALHLVLGAAEVDVSVVNRSSFGQTVITRPKTQSITRPMQRLLFLDPQAAHDTWVSAFPAAWSCLSRREQIDVTSHMINLLSKDYHLRQAELRPNVMQTLLTGILACSPPMILPPHLVKYLAKTFGAWHVAMEILANSLENMKEDDAASVQDHIYDSLADVYAELHEEDVFYGVWRRRCLHQDTNVALAFEQNGMWDLASTAYETAQSKSRAGTIAFSETEYCLWEDHWILSAEKLQQWDVLYDLARNEGNQELMLECAWRTKDWVESREALEDQLAQLPEVSTPRRRVFETFIALLKNPAALDKNTDFTKLLEDAMQLSLRKWVSLPPHMSGAHVPLLQHFQQFVELQEAVQIFGSLSQTNAGNLEKKSSELKMVLQAWRERLPNLHDDISIWSDLIAWRQNVFNAINNAYLPLIQNNGNGTANSNTYGYRGYHETAWIINRFAHVARKHDLLDVCQASLSKIYTLPNIEISEAFLKLREQARCYYQKGSDLQAGLEVINNTNLVYFSISQKAEFYTLKGMFHMRLQRYEEANEAFGQAVQMDMTQAKSWAEWGRYNDRMFKENPTDLTLANNAVSSYLQAAGHVDDATNTISRAFDTYKGDAAFWYWITLIPQLCSSISYREVKQARYVLLNLARHYPQALFFQLRTTREEQNGMRKAAAARAAMNQANAEAARVQRGELPNPEAAPAPAAVPISNGNPPQPQPQPTDGSDQRPGAPASEAPQQRPVWDYIDEIVQIVKTAFPLLVLSLETMTDQVMSKFKSSNDDEFYRTMHYLISDSVNSMSIRVNKSEDDGLLTAQMLHFLERMLSICEPHSLKKEFEEDFFASKPSLYEALPKMQKWRDRCERMIDAKPRFQPLELTCHYLAEFQYAKVDDIEVFGQYTEEKDNNQNFVKIQKFHPKFENYRTNGNVWKRIFVHGNDNSKTAFSVQNPCHRQSRREEKVMQPFRTFNGVLARKKESRKRNLNFHIPAHIPFSPALRLIQTDSSYISFIDIYDLHCQKVGMTREDPLLYAADKMRKVLREYRTLHQKQPEKSEYIALKKAIFDEICLKMVPDNILTRFMVETMKTPSDLWRMRKAFALHIAACSFMTYTLCVTSRIPTRFSFSRLNGQVTMSDIIPGLSNQLPSIMTTDVVPFRFTPNMQTFLGPIFTEGILTSGIMAIARCLTEPEYDLEYNLCLFGRDEAASWMAMRGKPWSTDVNFRQNIGVMIQGIVQRAESMACKIERDQATAGAPTTIPVIQTVTNMISSATNPTQLSKMGEIFYPWY